MVDAIRTLCAYMMEKHLLSNVFARLDLQILALQEMSLAKVGRYISRQMLFIFAIFAILLLLPVRYVLDWQRWMWFQFGMFTWCKNQCCSLSMQTWLHDSGCWCNDQWLYRYISATLRDFNSTSATFDWITFSKWSRTDLHFRCHVSEDCDVNNGGCDANAKCSHDPKTYAVLCTCKPGYVNVGVGSVVVCKGNENRASLVSFSYLMN